MWRYARLIDAFASWGLGPSCLASLSAASAVRLKSAPRHCRHQPHARANNESDSRAKSPSSCHRAAACERGLGVVLASIKEVKLLTQVIQQLSPYADIGLSHKTQGTFVLG